MQLWRCCVGFHGGWRQRLSARLSKVSYIPTWSLLPVSSVVWCVHVVAMKVPVPLNFTVCCATAVCTYPFFRYKSVFLDMLTDPGVKCLRQWASVSRSESLQKTLKLHVYSSEFRDGLCIWSCCWVSWEIGYSLCVSFRKLSSCCMWVGVADVVLHPLVIVLLYVDSFAILIIW